MIKIEPTSWSGLLSLEVIFLCIFFLIFIVWLPSVDHNHLCMQPLLRSHFLDYFTSYGMFWSSFGLFLHWSKSFVGNNFTTSKYESLVNSYIDIQNGCFLLAMFSMYIFIFSWYYKVFLSSFILTTMYLFLSLTLFDSTFTSASSLVFSATFSSSSCNKTGLLLFQETDCVILFPFTIAFFCQQLVFF